MDLRKAQSWGALRDNLISGNLDAAHLLITIPVQSALFQGPDGFHNNLCFAFNLSRNGNGIILANQFWNQGVREASGLASWLKKNPNQKLRFGVVFPQGTQEYFLRSWLSDGELFI